MFRYNMTMRKPNLGLGLSKMKMGENPLSYIHQAGSLQGSGLPFIDEDNRKENVKKGGCRLT